MSLAVGIDIGGTFTDAVAVRNGGGEAGAWTAKVPTRPDDHGAAVAEAVASALAQAGARPGDVERLVHGTTIGTNAVLQERGARLGILTTAGFEDTLFIGRLKRTAMYDLFTDAETPHFLCPRHRIRGIPGRLDAGGAEIEPLDERAVVDAAAELVDVHGVESIAVCLLFSFESPAHEERVAELIRRAHPHVEISLSSHVDPRFREYERLVVTAFDAYVKPLVRRYLTGLRERLAEDGVGVGVQVMESHGGVLDSGLVAERPVGTLLSGLAAGVVGAQSVGALSGLSDLVTLDMGGTSADVALVAADKPLITDDGRIGRHPVRQPMIDVATIGAGGGSIASVDDGGNLRVGPHSAGSVPGPAAYDRGGSEPTVSDANLVLGLLAEDGLAGGNLRLRRDLAERAVERGVAAPLGLDVAGAAWGVHQIVTARMADAIRLVSVQRGYDPRRFSLVASGGAGPLHACGVAEHLGIDRVLVPAFPGLLSAYGLLAADVQAQEWRTFRAPLDELDADALEEVAAVLETECRRRLDASGAAAGRGEAVRVADMRYVGQSHELAVPLEHEPLTADALTRLRRRFDEVHEGVYGQHDPDGRPEITAVRVSVRLASAAPPLRRAGRAATPSGTRDVWDPGAAAYRPVPVVARDDVADGLAGPAIITQDDTTTFVRAAWVARRLGGDTLALERAA